MLISASCFVRVQVDKLLCVVIEQEFAVESEIGGRYADSGNAVAPNFFVMRNIESGAIREIEVVRLVSIIAAPNYATRLVAFAVNRPVENFANQRSRPIKGDFFIAENNFGGYNCLVQDERIHLYSSKAAVLSQLGGMFYEKEKFTRVRAENLRA